MRAAECQFIYPSNNFSAHISGDGDGLAAKSGRKSGEDEVGAQGLREDLDVRLEEDRPVVSRDFVDLESRQSRAPSLGRIEWFLRIAYARCENRNPS
jgi:hypothetical protein